MARPPPLCSLRDSSSTRQYRVTLRSVILPAPHHAYTFEEYLELEEISGIRHEYYRGAIYAMAGGTPEHAAVAAAITTMLGRQLDATTCRVYSSDLRVRVLATGLATYPDVTVICGPSERDPNSPTHVTNPKLVVEVSSPSTADYDRGEKLLHYQQIPSLEAVLLVDHLRPGIDLWTRTADGWHSEHFDAGQSIGLAAIACTLSVDDVYAAARGA
jgi:Uma2 family endonuclease